MLGRSAIRAKPNGGILLITTITDLAIMTFSTNELSRPCKTQGDTVGCVIFVELHRLCIFPFIHSSSTASFL